jgi:hypothetical protein
MPLSCNCDWEPEPGSRVYYEEDDYTIFCGKRRKRCASCNEMVDIGDTCILAKTVKIPETDVEVNIYGEDGEVPLADTLLCERCADIYLSLRELGFCVLPVENMLDLIKEYQAQFVPAAGGEDHG